MIHSISFRRLRHKTQVFMAPDGDHFRVRLTHSIEVAQIGRAVARALGLNEDLTEALCLAHDIGHPPFGHAGEDAAAAAAEHGIQLEVVKLPEAKRGFVLLPRRWVVERSFGRAARFRRLARDYERLSETLEGLHYVAFSLLMLHKAAPLFVWSS